MIDTDPAHGSAADAQPAGGAGPQDSRLARYARLTRLDKPIGIVLLLWPTLDALWLACGGWPGWILVLVFCLGTVLMRSAGCALNDVADRNFDGRVERTAGRVVATGAVRPAEAIAVAAVLVSLAALALPFLDPAVLPLAVVAVVLSATYPYFKRFFPLPQAYLGIAFSFGIPMAYAGVNGNVPASAWLLFAANLFWVIAYDTEYAMVDRRDDLRIGLRSSAILFGRSDVFAVAVCYGIYLGGVAGIARIAGLGWLFVLGWMVALMSAVLHIWWIRGRDPQQCLRAFRHNHWLGLAIFAGIVLDLTWAAR